MLDIGLSSHNYIIDDVKVQEHFVSCIDSPPDPRPTPVRRHPRVDGPLLLTNDV